MRVVSLVPSVTETLLAWGVELVACTRFCEQPSLPHVGGTKNPDNAAIADLRPDLVVVNDEENRREDAEALADAGIDVHVVTVRSLDDVAPALVRLAERVGVHFEPWPPVASPPPAAVKTAFVPIWRRPWMTLNADTYGSSVLAAVGIANVFADAPERYPTITLEDAVERHPDVVLAPTEPYPFRIDHVPELEKVAPVEVVDGKDLFWWGVRTPAAVERLQAALRST
ncbi:MAG TPA: helical backbone metal receptor [Acidimicrobiales bacterium]|nr:helical backbone metal receptor [Acidimicrobiales bacterium]